MEHLAPLAAVVRPLGDADHRARRGRPSSSTSHTADKLALAAVDQQQVGPFAALPVGIVLLEPGEAPLEHLAHHREIVAGRGLGRLMLNLR